MPILVPWRWDCFGQMSCLCSCCWLIFAWLQGVFEQLPWPSSAPHFFRLSEGLPLFRLIPGSQSFFSLHSVLCFDRFLHYAGDLQVGMSWHGDHTPAVWSDLLKSMSAYEEIRLAKVETETF